MVALSRRTVLRRLLGTAATGAAGGALLACTPTPPTVVTPAPAKPVATVVPAATAASSAANAQPTAPAAAVPTAAAAPTSAPAAKPSTPVASSAPAGAPRLGDQLVGKLEGPEVVLDPARYPASFKEAPQLAELVAAGKLPAVTERIGQDPLVVKPVHEIGKYGGVWRRGHTGPADMWNGLRAVSGPDQLLFWAPDGNTIVPNIARDWKVSEDGRTTTLYLRRGMKWSDGHPFTADDILFWFEDMYQNKDLVPTPTVVMSINGKPGTVEKIDAHTVAWKFAEPYFMFPEMLTGGSSLAGHAHRGVEMMGAFAPAHYLKGFHPKYTPKERLDQLVSEAKLDNWVKLFKIKNDWSLNPDLPVVTPWRTVTPISTPSWTVERNPYSIWVDTAGNQLPYIDKVQFQLAENLEVLNLRAIAGEYDMQARHIDISKLPVLLENQQKGNYKVALDIGGFGSDMLIKVNLAYEADPEIAKWLNTVDFRRALSLGIDRAQINETFWLGTGTPSSVVPIESNPYSPGPEYRTRWATYEPDRANQLLDALGLTQKDAEGFRQRTDGKGRLRLEIMTAAGQFINFAQISEMIRQQWRRIGIDLTVNEVERNLAISKAVADEQQLSCWNNDGSEHLFTHPFHVFAFDVNVPSTSGASHAKWFQSGGSQGKEPPPRVRELMEKWKRAFGVPEAERVQLGKEIWQIAADDVLSIGVVGLAAAAGGVRVTKNTMGNVPSRQVNSPDVKTPSISRPVTFYWKS